MNIEYTQRERKELIIDITQECKCGHIKAIHEINYCRGTIGEHDCPCEKYEVKK